MVRSFMVFLMLSVSIFYVNAQQTRRYSLSQFFNENKLLSDTATKINVLKDKNHVDAITVKGIVWLKDVLFTKGTIDVDLRGKNVFLQSFLGIAFHGVNDSTYDLVYFRPFNFKHEDTSRRKWSVQYMSMSDYDYDKLRKLHPLVYENAVTPAPDPDDWFHATIIVSNDSVVVYVDHATTASLTAHLLNNST